MKNGGGMRACAGRERGAGQASVTPGKARGLSVWRVRFAALLVATCGLQAQANQLPTASSGGTAAADTVVTKTYPSALTYTLTLSGGNSAPFRFDGQEGLNDSGNAVSAYYSPGIAVGAANSATRVRVYGPCAVPSGGGVCTNRGTVTITFSQPVTNAVLHVAGFGGESNNLDHSPIFRLTSPASGVTLSSVGSPSNMNITTTSFTSGPLNGESNCNAAGTGAGCGSIRVNGTVTTLVFAVDLRAQGSLDSSRYDTIGITATVDEDFSDAPTTSFNTAQAPSHIVGNLRLGAALDADHVGVTNSITSPFPVAANADNNGGNGDGVDEDAIGTFPALTSASTGYSLTVPISGASKAGIVCGWIDFDRSNAFVVGERACTSFASGATSVVLSWTGLSGLTPGQNYVRLRAGYTTSQIQTADGRGYADSGEVEDYRLTISVPLTVAKTWVGATINDAATLSVSGTPAPALPPAPAIAPLSAVANSANETDTATGAYGVVRGNTYTVTEAFSVGAAANYTKSLSCTGNTGTGAALSYTANALSGTVTIGSTANNVVCTFTNTARPRVTISKVSLGGVGTFAFTGSNGIAAQNITTTVAGTAVSGATQFLTTAGTQTTVTEGVPPAGYALTGIACTGLPASGTATPNLSTRTVTLNAAATVAGANVTCTFTNTRIPILRLQKSLPNGRVQDTDQFTLSMSGPNAPAAVTTAGSGSTATGTLTHANATAGSAYTLSEAAAGTTVPAQYTSSYACTNARAGGQTPTGSGTSFSVTPVAGDDLTCTFANSARLTDIAIVKSASAPTVASGQTVQFTLLVSNNGALAANGTQVVDLPTPGLSCSTVTCTANGGAVCPASPTIGALQTAPGLTIPTLPSGGAASFLVTCNVTASGTL